MIHIDVILYLSDRRFIGFQTAARSDDGDLNRGCGARPARSRRRRSEAAFSRDSDGAGLIDGERDRLNLRSAAIANAALITAAQRGRFVVRRRLPIGPTVWITHREGGRAGRELGRRRDRSRRADDTRRGTRAGGAMDAPSTPPPPSREALAALTMASTRRVVMSPTTKWGRRSISMGDISPLSPALRWGARVG